jgi:hypothetical protein
MVSSEPSPFTSSNSLPVDTNAVELKKQQLANEELFKQLNQQRLIELEEQENKQIKEETKDDYTININKNDLLSGFSKTILDVINDIVYKLGRDDDNLSWSDIFTSDDRLFYIGILIVVLAIVISLIY